LLQYRMPGLGSDAALRRPGLNCANRVILDFLSSADKELISQRESDMPQITDPVNTEQLRKGYRALLLSAVGTMALGVFYAVVPFTGHGIFHVIGGIVIFASGLYILGIARRVKRKSRDR
jgi:hypothetical protein